MFETHLWEYNHWEIMEYHQYLELQRYLGSHVMEHLVVMEYLMIELVVKLVPMEL
ncbi:hypothetical protein Tco_0061438, partial [Tanacetum coccineum]